MENVATLFQMLVLLTAGLVMLFQAKSHENGAPAYYLIGGLFCFFLGNSFFLIHTLLRGIAPLYFSASDIAWIGGYWFFLESLRPPRRAKQVSHFSLILTIITVVVFIIIMHFHGHILLNLIWAIPLIGLAWRIGNHMPSPLSLSMVTILLLNLILFLSWGWVYVVVDVLMTLSLLSISLTYRKEALQA